MSTTTKTENVRLENMRVKASQIIFSVMGYLDKQHGGNLYDWRLFRDFLVSRDCIDTFRTGKDFKLGLHMVNQIIDVLHCIYDQDSEYEYMPNLYGQIASQLIGDEIDEKYDVPTLEDRYKAILCIQECLRLFSAGCNHDDEILEESDLNELRIDIAMIISCQKMVLDVFPKI
jgi:hypothetical protein